MDKERHYLSTRDETFKSKLSYQKLEAIISHLNYEFSIYKFTVYRCASKIFTLQKLFFTSTIPYKLFLQILENHHLNNAEDNLPIRASQLFIIIRDIYFGSDKLDLISEKISFNLDSATEILKHFIWTIFDKNQKGYITLLEIKATFLFLCEVSCMEKMSSAYFQLVADQNRCVSKYRFQRVLKILTKILAYMHEDDAYGPQNVPEIVDQCYLKCPGINGLNEYQFHCLWTTTQTRFLIYSNLLALVKRIKSTEKLIHNVQCASCHIEKIIGIRFKCESCKKLSLCLRCFSIGYSNNKHESGRHRMYEVFTDDLPEKKWTHFLAKLCSVFFAKSSEESIELTGDDVIGGTYNSLDENNAEMITIDTKLTSNTLSSAINQRTDLQSIKSSLFDSTSSSSFTDKLQNVVLKLTSENEKITKHKNTIKDKGTVEFLDHYQKNLAEVIEQLKILIESSKVISYPTSSTPNRRMSMEPRLDSSQLSHSINGAEINRSYLEANKSDYSINDLSVWFHQKRNSINNQHANLSIVKENYENEINNDVEETDMRNFRELLNKVREIVDDLYSDNNELACATQNLESVLDGIIKNEEKLRSARIV